MSRPAMRLRALTKPAVKPIGGLMDRDPVTGENRFKYTHSDHQDLRATFARIRREGSPLNPPQVNQKEKQ